jgi:hypothetical protein
MDVVKLSGMKLWGCRDLGEAGGQIAGCIRPVYKNAELYRDSVVASSGRAHTLIELTLHGRIEKTFTIWTQGDQHVGDFVIDQRGGIVYQVGSCGYTGGLSEVNIQSTARRALIGVNTELCGERLSLSRDGMIVIGRVTGVIPHAAVLGTLIAVDANSGRVLRRMKVPSEPVDVLVADTG